MHSRFLIILALSLVVVVMPSFAEDRTAQRVEVAEERFEKAVERVAEKLEAAMDKGIEKARKDGKLDQLVALQEQKQLYLEKELIPRHPAVSRESKSYYQTLDREGDKLLKIYKRALEDYTKAGQLDAAKGMQERIDWLRPLSSLKTVEFGDHQYLLVEEAVSWHKARDRCVELGGYLGCVNSEKENKLFHLMKGDHRVIWIGLSDEAKEGSWQWVDGSRLQYQNWAPGEPNGDKVHSAAVLFGHGVWDDVNPVWGEVRAYICEWDYEVTRRTLKKSSGSPGELPDRLYIWNSFQGDRGVGICDIELRQAGKLIREIKGVELQLQANKAVRNTIKLPNVQFDEVEIQVLGWHGHSAGLTEVALHTGEKNLTTKFTISVDHDRANKYYDPKHMIDGDLSTEWFPDDGRRCQINLKINTNKVPAGDTDDETVVEIVKAATLKHNRLIVTERKRLQEAILRADQEEAIEDAKIEYNRDVASIKQKYIDELQGVLDKAIASDRLDMAGKVKTQILRVKGQIKQLSSVDVRPDVPALDDGGENNSGRGSSDQDEDNTADEVPKDPSVEEGDGDVDFFGIPLE